MIPAVGAVLSARDLYRFFRTGDEETLALQGVSLDVYPGEFVAVIGPSGSGKSTLMACLSGIDEPAGGSAWVSGERMSHRPEWERAALRAKRVGLLFQSSNLLPHLTVTGNVRLVEHLAGTRKSSAQATLNAVGLTARAHAYPSQLSGGEASRAGLAVALANNPAVILADEPTGELDSATEQRLLSLLNDHTDLGAGVLVVTHSDAVVAQADRVIQLADGRVHS